MPQPQASAEATVGQASVSIPAQATKRLAFALGLALLAWVLVQAWPALQTWPNLPRPDGHWLAASGALLGLAFLNGVGLWRLWLRAMGARLSYGEAFAVVHGSNLAKYLPGGLWHLVGGVVLAQRKGVQGPQGALAFSLDTLGQLAGALLWLLACSLWLHPGPVAPALAVALLVAFHPRLLNAAFASAEGLLRRPMPRLAWGQAQILGMLLLHALNWAFISLAFGALLKSLLPELPPPYGLDSFAMAWWAGMVAPLAPGGLGVREASLTLLLAPLGPSAMAPLLALAARLWFLMGEALAFLVAWWLVAFTQPSKAGLQDPPAGSKPPEGWA